MRYQSYQTLGKKANSFPTMSNCSFFNFTGFLSQPFTLKKVKLNLFLVMFMHVSTQEKRMELWLRVQIPTNICWGGKAFVLSSAVAVVKQRHSNKSLFSKIFTLSGRTVTDLRKTLVMSGIVEPCQISHVDSFTPMTNIDFFFLSSLIPIFTPE